jgi:hypothetical protein
LVEIILGSRKFEFVQRKGQVYFKGEIITKMDGVILKSPKPLGQF